MDNDLARVHEEVIIPACDKVLTNLDRLLHGTTDEYENVHQVVEEGLWEVFNAKGTEYNQGDVQTAWQDGYDTAMEGKNLQAARHLLDVHDQLMSLSEKILSRIGGILDDPVDLSKTDEFAIEEARK